MPQSKQRHAEYMRNRRKLKKDAISKRIEEQGDKVKQESINEQFIKKLKKELTWASDSWGRTPQLTQEPQFEHEPEVYGCNLWHSDSERQQHKKPSYQDILRQYDPKHSE